ncbi:MAG: STAS domain-containing protein [Planctomycetes bacterium]|nr:STAS domain-containing protein [Planctomycetota bacterium]
MSTGDKMEVTQKKIGGALVLSLDGRLDQLAAPLLNGPLNSGNLFIVLDMEGVDYVASSGISLLLSMTRRAREQDGDIVLARMQRQIATVITSMRLDKVFDVFTDVESAAKAVVEGPTKPPPEERESPR